MSDESPFKKGEKVFRFLNPGRQGYLTGRSRTRADNNHHQVDFPDKMEYVPEYELEIVNTEHSDEYWLIGQRRFGKAFDLRRNLSHIQLSGKLSSIIYSLDATNTDFYPHQFKPVLAFLDSPSNGMLIADEVGLGKTIEAGLIWTELRARYDYRRVLVVCPAMLREKWRDELRVRFGIEATIMDATELLSELNRAPDRISDGKGIICSIQGIRPWRDKKNSQNQFRSRDKLASFFEDQAGNPPLLDLVIIDEAHYLRNRSSQNAHLARMLREISKHILLLSATPINLKSEDLFNQLNIVDPDTFVVPDFFPLILQANEPLLKARNLALDKKSKVTEISQALKDAAGYSFLSNSSQIKNIINTLEESKGNISDSSRVRIADKIERVNLLSHVVNRTRKIEVLEWKVIRRAKSQFVELEENGVERKFYDAVTESVKEYADKMAVNEGFLLDSPQRQISSCMYAAAKSWRDRENHADKNAYKEMLYEDMGIETNTVPALSPLIDHLNFTVLPSLNIEELRTHDSKFNTFLNVIREYLTEHPHEKIVVFSYFRATLYYLSERLAEHEVSCQVLVGGMKESKQDAIDRFKDDPKTRILLSSQVASEGVDLQFCRVLVNYDLPWNPMKIEQRIGRLDRIGQQSESILIWNLGYADTIDQRIYERLFLRLDIFTRALGGMEAILGEEIKKLTGDIISHQLTAREQEDRISQTAIAIENKRHEEEKLEKDAANLMAHGGYILKRVQLAYDLKKRITENDLIIYVQDYLNKHVPGHEFHQLKNEEPRFNITLPQATAAQLSEYIERKNLHRQTKLAEGIRVECKFVSKIHITTGAIEQISQLHPLVRFVSEKIGDGNFFPVVAVKIQNKQNENWSQISGLPSGQYAFSIEKWSFTGLREEEDMRVQAIHIESDLELDPEDSWKLLNAARLFGDDWPEAISEACPSSVIEEKIDICHIKLNEDFRVVKKSKEAENHDRVNLQVRSAERHRDRQVKSLESVLNNYISQSQTRMIPATQGRIEKIKLGFGIQIEKLQLKSNMEGGNSPVCCGILLLK